MWSQGLTRRRIPTRSILCRVLQMDMWHVSRASASPRKENRQRVIGGVQLTRWRPIWVTYAVVSAFFFWNKISASFLRGHLLLNRVRSPVATSHRALACGASSLDASELPCPVLGPLQRAISSVAFCHPPHHPTIRFNLRPGTRCQSMLSASISTRAPFNGPASSDRSRRLRRLCSSSCGLRFKRQWSHWPSPSLGTSSFTFGESFSFLPDLLFPVLDRCTQPLDPAGSRYVVPFIPWPHADLQSTQPERCAIPFLLHGRRAHPLQYLVFACYVFDEMLWGLVAGLLWAAALDRLKERGAMHACYEVQKFFELQCPSLLIWPVANSI